MNPLTILVASIVFFQPLNLLMAQDNSSVHQGPTLQNDELGFLREQNNQWILPFVKDFFLQDALIYTLFGSKPMTLIQITNMSKEESLKSWKMVLDDLDHKYKSLLLKKIDIECRSATVENFTKWIEFKKKYPNSVFLFRTSPPTDDNKYIMVTIANVIQLAWIMQKNYDLFVRETGIKFDSVNEAKDFENKTSIFWEKVLSNAYLLGILYGYGEKNAYFYSKEMHHSNFPSCLVHKPNEVSEFSLQSLNIPNFRSFELPFTEDPVVRHYLRERENIQNKLKDKDICLEVLKIILAN